MNIYEYGLYIYPLKIWIVFGEADFSDTYCYLDGEPVVTNIGSDCTCEANTIGDPVVMEVESRDAGIIIQFRSRRVATPDTVAHEASHAAKRVFKHVGADINPDEPFEYLLSYIVKCIFDAKSEPKRGSGNNTN